jgi:transposase
MEARRLKAARLFARGESQGAVAKALGVTRVSAHHWFHTWKAEGRAGLKGAGRAGRKPQLDAGQLATLDRALRTGPRAHGFSTDLWTLPRVAALIAELTGSDTIPAMSGGYCGGWGGRCSGPRDALANATRERSRLGKLPSVARGLLPPPR